MTDDLRRLAAGTLMAGFTGPVVPGWVARAIDDGLASICLYGSNVESPQQLSDLTRALRGLGDVLLTTDEEGGDVTRLHYLTGSPQPGAAALGHIDGLDLTRECAAAAGSELAALGIGLNLGPIADVNSNPANPVIGTRSFGASAPKVAAHVAAWVEAQQRAGAAACVKHFPGHGDTPVDSHHGLPEVSATEQVLAERELVPFDAAISAGVAAIMTAHLVVPELDPDRPATFSPQIIGGLLRGRLGFEGVVVTDALDMAGATGTIGRPEAAVRALAAGCDLLCLGSDMAPEDYDAVLDAIVGAMTEGRLGADRVRQAAGRVRALAAKFPPTGHAAQATLLPGRAAFAHALSVGPGVDAWLAAPGPWVVVQVGSSANLAVGEVPWGLGSIMEAVAPDAVRPGERVVLAARGIGTEHPAVEVAARLRSAGHPTLLIEHGWPRPGVAVDVITHGGSPTLAALLLDRLDPERRRP